MNDELFKRCWDYWCGLFPVFSRERAAYFRALKFINDKDFEVVSKQVVFMTDNFPSVRQIRSCFEQLSKGRGTYKGDDDKQVRPEAMTTPELEHRIEHLVELISGVDQTKDVSIFNSKALEIWNHSLDLCRRVLAKRSDSQAPELKLEEEPEDVPAPPEPSVPVDDEGFPAEWNDE